MSVITPVPAHQPAIAAPAVRARLQPQRVVDLLRIALGFTMLWPFLDKLFGLGYSTSGAKSWISGGSPTNGFLSHVSVGPFQSAFRGIAGTAWANTLFMLALLGIGVALLLGVALRIAAISGTILLVLMWAAEWPMAQFTSTGETTGSTNPILDYHLIYALGLLVVAALGTASSWGVGQWWTKRPMVAAHALPAELVPSGAGYCRNLRTDQGDTWGPCDWLHPDAGR